ncbi:MAG: hypothetical protein ACOY4O_03125 [Pseudomonadota bacterium]
MFPSSQADSSHGAMVSDAHRIAWYFLKATGQVCDDYADHVLLSRIVVALADRGVTHRIRLANMAIGEFGRETARHQQSPRLIANRRRF